MTRVPFYTYSLGRSLYVPLTCRCNSRTLPETRGPHFLLPPDVVSALCRFRDLELQEERWSHWCNWLDTQEGDQTLPEAPEKVETAIDCPAGVVEAALQAEIEAQLERSSWDNIKFGGEGEPTLNLPLLESLSREFSNQLPITVMTNGLTDCSSESLKDWGVSSVSVPLLTHDAQQYQELMSPVVVGGHDKMCSFVQSSLSCDLCVELTGIDRPDVDKDKAQELATKLGVETEIRWRPYFP